MIRIKLLITSFFIYLIASSQCSMCRAVAESSHNDGSSIANGLNTGILYLMAFPYLLLLFGLISFFFTNHKTN